MSNDPGSTKIGEISKESFECDVISWKIPNVSSLEITESTEWQSPQFSYKNATWTLKMSTYSEYYANYKRSIKVDIERLDSEIPEHNFSYSIFFKNRKVVRFGTRFRTLHFDSHCNKRDLLFELTDWYEFFHHSTRYRHNDTITLVLEIVTKKNAVIGLHTDTETSKTDLSTKFTKKEDYLKSIGEISKASFDVDVVAWKISKINTIPVEVDNSVQSSTFSFAGATWSLKLFLNGQTKFKSKGNVDVAIERLNSEIQKHFISCRCFFKPYNESESVENYYKGSIGGCSNVTNDFIVDSNHTQEDIVNIKSYKDFRNLSATRRQFGTVVLIFEFRIPKNHDTALNILSELLPSVIRYKHLTSSNVPTSFTTSETTWKPITGEIIKESVECEVITWKIPNASSLLYEKNNYVQSPPFSYKGAKWILKFHTELNQTSQMNVVLQRLHSQTPDHDLFLKIYFKSIFHKHNWYGDYSTGSFLFDANHSQNKVVLNSYADFLYIYYHHRSWDTLILVCEIYTKENGLIKFDFETKSFETDLSNKCTINDDSSGSVGELYIESFSTEFIMWKIPEISSKPVEVDNELQSPSFVYEGASWVFKLYLYGQTKFESDSNVDVVIKRWFSKISKHEVSYKLFFRACDDKFSEKMHKVEDLLKEDLNNDTKTFTFFPNHTEENITSLKPYSDLLELVESRRLCDAIILVCVLRTRKNVKKILNSERTSVKVFHEGFDRKSSHCGVYPVEKLLRDFKELFLNQEDCDVILKVKGQEFPAHRIILKARSSVFSCTFRNNMKEKATGIVDIEDCDPSCFSEFLRFLYCGSVENLTTENVFSLFKAADKYDVQDLKSQCLEFIKRNLSVDSFCDTIALAVQHSEKELIELATDFFAKNFQKIIVTVKWQSFLLENPIQGNEILIKALVNGNK